MLDLIKTIAKFLPGYLTSVIALVAGPKTYIAKHNRSDDDLQDVLLFAAVSSCISLFLTPQIFLPNGDITKNLGTRIVAGLVFVILQAAVIAGAFRLVGGKAPFMRFLVAYLYLSSMEGVLLSVVYALSTGIALAIDAESVKQYIQFARETTPFGESAETKESIELLSSTGVRVLYVAFGIGAVLGYTWFIACWGSFRQITNLSRSRSAVAFVLTFVALPPLGYTAALVTRSFGLW